MSVGLEIQKREVRPRSLRNQLRREGKIPAVVYGYQVDSTPIAVEAASLEKLLRENGTNTVITITVAGKKINTLLYKTQLDTFTGKIKHAEFLAVNMSEETEVEAELVLVGDAKGVKAGGVLMPNLHTVLVAATPDNLPEKIEVDVTAMEIGDTITVADLPKNSDYTIITDPEEQVAAVTEMPVMEEEPIAPAEAAEPEVIGEADNE